MRYWMCHWQIRNWRNDVNSEGERLSSAFSSRFSKRGVKKGDVVFITSLRNGRLMLGGKMTVGNITPPSTNEREEWLHARRGSGTPLNLDRPVPRRLTRELRFISSDSKTKGLLFDRNDKTRLDVQTTRGIRELTMESAGLLDDLIEGTDGAKVGKSLPVSASLARRRTKESRGPLPTEEKPGADYYEGAAQHSLVNRYERSSKARSACIRHYGAACCICGTDLSALYGLVVKGLIHVHHLSLVSEADERSSINPIDDLRPVCPNCHAVLHHRTPPYSIEDVRQFLKRMKRAI